MADFPFLFLNHGTPSLDAVGKVGGCYLGFKAPPDEASRRAIERDCPPAIAGFFCWGGTLFSCESLGDVFDFEVMQYDPAAAEDFEVSWEAAEKFAEHMERWVRAAHARCPLEFAIGPGYPEEPTDWHRWSAAALPEALLSHAERWLVEHAPACGKGGAQTGVFGTSLLPWLLSELDDEALTPGQRARLSTIKGR
jgi:hypothetical protein